MSGDGFAKRVTIENLASFAPLLKQRHAAKDPAAASASTDTAGDSDFDEANTSDVADRAFREAEALFAGARIKAMFPFKRSAKPPTVQTIPTAGSLGVPASAPGVSPRVPLTITRRWFKKMSKADAQRPNPGTSPTGHLTLTKGGFAIDQATYFRNDFLGDVAWIAANLRGKNREQATIPVEVVIRGKNLGVHHLVFDFNPAFAAEQGNRTTTLHWGPDLNARMRRINYVGKYVTIERRSDGSTRLEISDSMSGPFLK